MAALNRYMADTSAFARHRVADVAAVIDPLITRGLLATCGILELALLHPTRNFDDLSSLAYRRRTCLQWLPMEDADIRRALETQAALAQRGHRVAWPDLVTAAVAERHEVTLLHYAAAYDLIAGLTSQKTQWVVPKGSLKS
jgi:predicted nucleic acid-binding protein